MKRAIQTGSQMEKSTSNWKHKCFATALALTATLAAPAAQAQTNLFWDANGGTTGTGGTGVWDTTSFLWRDGSTTGTLGGYTNSSGNMTANLGGTAGTLTIAPITAINANLINVTTGGYTIAGGAGSTLNLDGTTPTIATSGNGLTISANITGSNGFTKTGTGTLTLTGTNTFTGGFVWNETNNFVLSLGSDGALGSNALTFNGASNQITIRSNDSTAHVYSNSITSSKGAVVFGATSTFNGDLTFGGWTKAGGNQGFTVNNSNTTLASYTSTGGTITKGGVGNLIVSGNWNQSGATALTLNNGTLAVAGTYSNTVAAQLGGTLSAVLGRNGSLTAALNAANGVKWAGTADGGLFAYGSNATWGNAANNLAVNFGGAGAVQTWGSTANFIATGRTLILGNTLSNGTVDFQNALNLNAATRTVQVDKGATNTANKADAKFSGVISNGGLTKTGSGVLALSAVNTYTGATTVSAGTLLVNGTLDAGSAVTIDSGATLGGSGIINGDTTINGILAPGESPGVLTFNGALTLAGTTNMEINGLTRGSLYDGIDTGGALFTLGGGLNLNFGAVTSDLADYDLFNIGAGGTTGSFSSVALGGLYSTVLSNSGGVWTGTDGVYNFSFSQATGNLSIAAVPEPSTYLLLAGGLGLLALLRRRKKV